MDDDERHQDWRRAYSQYAREISDAIDEALDILEQARLDLGQATGDYELLDDVRVWVIQELADRWAGMDADAAERRLQHET
jgi:hypothetical protein